jgi:hypothetical protein
MRGGIESLRSIHIWDGNCVLGIEWNTKLCSLQSMGQGTMD